MTEKPYVNAKKEKQICSNTEIQPQLSYASWRSQIRDPHTTPHNTCCIQHVQQHSALCGEHMTVTSKLFLQTALLWFRISMHRLLACNKSHDVVLGMDTTTLMFFHCVNSPFCNTFSCHHCRCIVELFISNLSGCDYHCCLLTFTSKLKVM